MGKKEVRTRSPHHDDDDSQEESETSDMSGASSERRRLDSTREELREAGLPKQPSVWLRANSGRRSMIETMATAWPKSRSYRRVEFDHRTSWRSTWKPNSLHTMASDPPAMNHPSDVLTIRRFVRLAWIFTPLCCARKTKYIFGQVHQGEQSLKPSHHRHYELRLRSPNPSWSAISSTKSPRRPRIAPTQPALVAHLRRQGRGLIHIFDLFAMVQ